MEIYNDEREKCNYSSDLESEIKNDEIEKWKYRMMKERNVIIILMKIEKCSYYSNENREM